MPRWFAVGALLIALALAGGASYYASSSRDGLERVATDKGFDSQERGSAAEDSPLAGYDTAGVDNSRLSGGVAGVAGVVVVLLASGGLAFALRRRRATPDRDEG
jgi:hypothetical protein